MSRRRIVDDIAWQVRVVLLWCCWHYSRHVDLRCHKPKLARHVTSRRDTTRRTWRACRARHNERVERLEPRLFQHDGRRRSSSARVYKFSLLCSGFASISGTTSGKKWGGHVHPSPRCGDASEHVSCESRLSRLSWPACRALLFDKRDTSRHVTSRLFLMPKCMG